MQPDDDSAATRSGRRSRRQPLAAKIAVAAAFGTMLSATPSDPVGAHSWYPFECCHDRDCHAIPATDVEHVTGAFLYRPTHEFVPDAQARLSQDGDFHVCRLTPTSPILCFFYPPPSM